MIIACWSLPYLKHVMYRFDLLVTLAVEVVSISTTYSFHGLATFSYENIFFRHFRSSILNSIYCGFIYLLWHHFFFGLRGNIFMWIFNSFDKVCIQTLIYFIFLWTSKFMYLCMSGIPWISMNSQYTCIRLNAARNDAWLIILIKKMSNFNYMYIG